MPPRIPIRKALQPATSPCTYICAPCRAPYASLATTPAPSPHQSTSPIIQRYPRNQPPSHKPPGFRKSQLLRQYQSLLRSAPLIVIFQHNNLKSTEWMAIRRELASALQKVDEELAAKGETEVAGAGAEGVKIQVVQTGIFAAALRVVEFWDPDFSSQQRPVVHPSDPKTPTSEPLNSVSAGPASEIFTHALSTQAHTTAKRASRRRPQPLAPLLTGPLALLTFPTVTPQHLAAALSILSPSTAFPAPKRRAKPSYYEPAVQQGLQKLMLLGARVEGRVFDFEGVKWVGSIEGGLDGLRAQLVQMLTMAPVGLAQALEGVSKNLWVTMEGRRGMLEDESKGGESKG